jgi:hypothetical protein
MVKGYIANSLYWINNEILIINLVNLQFYAQNYSRYVSKVTPWKYRIEIEFYSSVAFPVLCELYVT